MPHLLAPAGPTASTSGIDDPPLAHRFFDQFRLIFANWYNIHIIMAKGGKTVAPKLQGGSL
jgi:hypothetical protein